MSSQRKYIVGGFITWILYVTLATLAIEVINWGHGHAGNWPFIKVFFVIASIVFAIVGVVYILWECDERSEDDYTELLRHSLFRWKAKWVWCLALLILVVLGIRVGGSLASVYNQSVVYYKQYDKATQALDGFYDNLWKTYTNKEKLANVSKETFIEITKTIMEARKDGPNVSWKWLQENQQIPYQEFTKFYADLSSFVQERRDQYYQLEVNRQTIAAAHNTLIDTFPNNFYNRILKREPIKYEYGFLSDSTRQVFASKVEGGK